MTATNSIDEYVGLRLKIIRSRSGMTQSELGEMSGVTFQQIQKYEKGANRIGAGRLFEYSKIFHIPINYFFDGYEKNKPTSIKDTLIDWKLDNNISEKEVMNLLKFFLRIENKKTRDGIIDLAKSLSKDK